MDEGSKAKNEPVDLGAFAASVHSQSGEDGILAEMFRRLEIAQGYAVEFGAWDGVHLSNACHLLRNGWSGCLIEGDPARFRDLEHGMTAPNIRRLNRFVAIEGKDCLDALLAEAGAPEIIDLLSIDIDGDDLAIFQSLKRVRACCVVIEYNPTIPFDTDFVNPPGRQWGNAALSIKRFAESAGYGLVAFTQTNLILLDNDAIARANVTTVPLERRPGEDVSRFFFGFDGTLLSSDLRRGDPAPEVFTVPWHHYRMRQPLPRFLRAYDRGRAAKWLELALSLGRLAITKPTALAAELRDIRARRAARRR